MLLHWILAIAASALATVGLAHYAALDAVLSYLAAVNVVTLLVYGYDKAIAGSERSRVPERLLLALAFVGGSVGAFLGMRLFRHKTAKTSFRVRFWIAVVVQAGLVAAYFLWLEPMLRTR